MMNGLRGGKSEGVSHYGSGAAWVARFHTQEETNHEDTQQKTTALCCQRLNASLLCSPSFLVFSCPFLDEVN
jgi:hypothetical protein